MNLGDTRLIIDTAKKYGLLRNQLAYVLATAYWETARTMEPVKEAFWLSEEWRSENLRYYPWYGRGYVQLTWEENYAKASKELGVDFIADPEAVMEPEHSVRILVSGMKEGWFTGKRLDQYLTLAQSNYVGARRIVNGTDKAQAIAELAREYDEALLQEGYGVDQRPRIADEKRDGTQPRPNMASSTTLQAAITAAAGTVTGTITAVSALSGTAQLVAIGAAAGVLLALAWIARERIKKWAAGDK